MKRSRRGFTLIEVAIVIIIIALIMGAIIVVMGVLNNAKLRSIAAQTDDYRKGFELFYAKYHGLPGDFYYGASTTCATGGVCNATDLWGEDVSCPGTPVVNNFPKMETCNGDGDNHILQEETHRAWQQLANAEFIKGRFSGVRTNVADMYSSTLGVNVPESGKEGVGYFIYYHEAGSPLQTRWTEAPYSNYIDIARPNPADNQTMTAASLSGSDALAIDGKMDDGLPGSGGVYATGGLNCINGQNYYADLTEQNACMLSVALGTQ